MDNLFSQITKNNNKVTKEQIIIRKKTIKGLRPKEIIKRNIH